MKRLLAILLVVAVIGAVGFFGYNKLIPTSKAATSLSTATVQLGTLVATVNAAGNITPHQQVNLNFQQSGVVKQVNVKVGDKVTAGETLAELDTADLALQLQNAQVNLKVAQDKLAQSKAPATAEALASARSKVDAAQAAYDKLAAGASQSDINAARAAVASAQAAYDAAVKTAGSSGDSLVAAKATLDKATAAVQQAQAAYDKVASKPDIGLRSESLNLQNATIDYNQAKANYESLASTSSTNNASQVAQAKSALQQAQANLQKLQTQVTKQDLTSAQATVDQAKNDLQTLLSPPDSTAVDIAQNAVTQSEIAVQQAQRALQQAQLLSPSDGTVTALNIIPGQAASATGQTAAVTLSDLANLEIVVNMAEVDVGQVKIGQDVQVTLDAVPNATLNGKVTEIAPAGVQTQGVVNYPVTISLTTPPAAVKSGMTANLNIVIQQHDNVLLVANRAVRSVGQQKVVTVLFEGQQIQTPVTTGLSNDTQTEITSGLKEGDTVVLSGTTTAQPRVGGGGIGGGIRGF